MKKQACFLLALLSCGCFAPAADAQIVRRIIGHAIAGKALRTIVGKDQSAESENAREAETDEMKEAGAGTPAGAAVPPEDGGERPQ